jgi:hypothetical protein
MLSSPRPTLDHQPLALTIANLQRLGARTQRELEQYLKEYAIAQVRNRGAYAVQGAKEGKTREKEPLISQPGEEVEDCRITGMASPLLKARVHLRQQEPGKEKPRGRHDGNASMKIKKEGRGSDENEEEAYEHPNKCSSRENRTRRKRAGNDDAGREANERNES